MLVMVLCSMAVIAQDEKPEPEEEEEKVQIDEQAGRDNDEQDKYDSRKNEKRRRKGDVRTLSGNNYHSGGFGAISFKGTQYMNETLMMAGIRGGWSLIGQLHWGLRFGDSYQQLVCQIFINLTM